MSKTGVSDEWTGLVNQSKGSMASVSKVPEINISKTDLKPFLQYKNISQSINKVLSSMKKFISEDSEKMIIAGENKRKDDQSASKSMERK